VARDGAGRRCRRLRLSDRESKPWETWHLRDDPDLEALRKDQRFEVILRRAQTLEAEQAKGTYDKPSDMPGVKTVDRQPEGGLRYHLRMPLEAPWRKAGVPLTIHAVPNKGHQWRVGPKEADALEAWLKKTKNP
jgi:hypothetical protein